MEGELYEGSGEDSGEDLDAKGTIKLSVKKLLAGSWEPGGSARMYQERLIEYVKKCNKLRMHGMLCVRQILLSSQEVMAAATADSYKFYQFIVAVLSLINGEGNIWREKLDAVHPAIFLKIEEYKATFPEEFTGKILTHAQNPIQFFAKQIRTAYLVNVKLRFTKKYVSLLKKRLGCNNMRFRGYPPQCARGGIL